MAGGGRGARRQQFGWRLIHMLGQGSERIQCDVDASGGLDKGNVLLANAGGGGQISLSHPEDSSGRHQIARKYFAQFAWYELRFSRTSAGALRRGPCLRRRGHTADPISSLISLHYRTNGAGTMIGIAARVIGTMLKPPYRASRLTLLSAASNCGASRRVTHNPSSDSLNFNSLVKLHMNSVCYADSCPTKRAPFSYQTGRSVPTSRTYFSYQTGGPLEDARPPPTRCGQFLPNGRLTLERPEVVTETATISYQTDGVTYSYLQHCRSSDGHLA